MDFVVIGGVAGGAHGSSYGTFDVDLAYARDPENLERIATVLRSIDATLRGAPPDLPFLLDAKTLQAGGNFTFLTSLGSVDLLAYPAGAPPYEHLKAAAMIIDVRGLRVRVASLDHLIAMKEASGRTKDKLMATEYRVLADEIRRPR
ncbi:MAG: nucleotidyltransferase [Gaiellaceae bacterium]